MADESITNIFGIANELTKLKLSLDSNNFKLNELHAWRALPLHITGQMMYDMDYAEHVAKKANTSFEDPPEKFNGLITAYWLMNGFHHLNSRETALKTKAAFKALPDVLSARLAGINEIAGISPGSYTCSDKLDHLSTELQRVEELKKLYDQSFTLQSKLMDAFKENSVIRDLQFQQFWTEYDWKVYNHAMHSNARSFSTGGRLCHAYTIANLFIIDDGTTIRYMMKYHYLRGLQYLCAMANVFTGLALEYPWMEVSSLKRDIMTFIIRETSSDPNGTPMVIKASRSLVVASMMTDKLLFDDPVAAFAETLDKDRSTKALEFIDIIAQYVSDLSIRVNICNIFKALIHPDTHLHRVFGSIEDLSTPNTVNAQYAERFKATYRNIVFNASRAAGKDVRIAMAEDFMEESPLMKAANESHSKFEGMKKYGYTDWDNVRIRPSRDFPRLEEIEIPISAKSSAKMFEFTYEQLEEARDKSALFEDIPDGNPFSDRSTVNDILSTLSGNCDLNVVRGLDYIKKIIEMHEEFEESTGYENPEDIPPELLSKFLHEHPEASFIVATEPKWGEKHKRDTRLFYIAPQKIKAITQMTERVVKQFAGRQQGVSITKSYKDRRRDVERMCRLMGSARSEEGGEDDPSRISLYVSFDMEKFSKRFPMKLMRKAGEILTEITGEKMFSRLDVVFRAATVIHNTRDYFGFKDGVKGGFEGFFNFLWTSIHAAIMRVALEYSGLPGDLLAFSDDGLLRILLPRGWSRERVQGYIRKLQQIYHEFGLEFNLAKVYVSSEVWEYLGDVAYKNRLIPMWVKEMSSLGIFLTQKGLNPSYMRIQTLEGQADALVSSGFSPLNSFIIKNVYYIILLLGKKADLTAEAITMLSILPPTVGGHRIHNVMEMSLSANIDPTTAFLEDVASVSIFYPIGTERIATRIVNRLIPITNAVKTIISGFVLKFDGPTCSGMGIMRKAIQKVECQVGIHVISDPFTGSEARDLNDFLENVSDIDMSSLRSFFMSLPSWVKYNESMALIRSSVCLSLIPRVELKRLQASDTRQVLTCIEAIQTTIRHGSNDCIGGPAGWIGREIRKICLKRFSVYVTPFGPITMLCRCKDLVDFGNEPGVIVNQAPLDLARPSQADVAEPRAKFAGGVTTLGWGWEIKRISSELQKKNVMATSAALVARFPESMEFVRALLNMNGLDIPSTVLKDLNNPARRAMSHSYDANLRSASPHVKVTISHYDDEGYRLVTTKRGCDKALPLVIAMAMDHYYRSFQSTYNNQSKFEYCARRYRFTATSIYHYSAPPMMHLKDKTVSYVRNRMVDPELHTIFIKAYFEAVNSADMIEQLELSNTSGTAQTSEQESWIISRAIDKGAQWLRSAGDTRQLGQLYYDEFPLCPINSVHTTACAVMRFALEEAGKANTTVIWKAVSKGEGSGPSKYLGHVQKIFDNARTFLIKSIFQGDLRERFMSYTDSEDTYKTLMRLELHRMYSVESLSKFVMKSHTLEIGKVGRSEAAHFRTVFTAYVSDLYNEGTSNAWGEYRSSSLNMEPHDRLIDAASTGQFLIRPSEHRSRSHPFNQVMAKVELMKMHAVAQRYFRIITRQGNLTGRENPIFLDQITPTYFEQAKVRQMLKGEKIGEDHELAISRPIIHPLFNRLKIYGRIVKRMNEDEMHKYKKKSKWEGLNPNLWLRSMDADEWNKKMIDMALGRLFDEFTNNLIRKAVFIDTDIEKHVFENFHTITRPTIPISQITEVEESLSNLAADIDAMKQYKTDEMQNLMMAHVHLMKLSLPSGGARLILSDFMGKGIKGLMRKDYLSTILAGTYVTDKSLLQGGEEYTITNYYNGSYDKLTTQLNLSIVFNVSDNPQQLISDYSLITRNTKAVLSIFYETTLERYVLCGCFVGGFEKFRTRVNSDNLSFQASLAVMETNLGSMVERMTLSMAASAAIDDLHSIKSMSSVASSKSGSVLGSKLEGATYLGYSRPYVNESDPLFQAIADAITATLLTPRAHGAYLAFAYWATTKGRSTPSGLADFMTNIIGPLTVISNRSAGLNQYKSYVGNIISWFSRFCVTEGAGVDHNLTLQYREVIDGLSLQIPAPPIHRDNDPLLPEDINIEYTSFVTNFYNTDRPSVEIFTGLLAEVVANIFEDFYVMEEVVQRSAPVFFRPPDLQKVGSAKKGSRMPKVRRFADSDPPSPE